jgi:hypothetical protein
MGHTTGFSRRAGSGLAALAAAALAWPAAAAPAEDPVTAASPVPSASPAAAAGLDLSDEQLAKLPQLPILAEGELPKQILVGDTVFLKVPAMPPGARAVPPRGDAELVKAGWKLLSSEGPLLAVVPLQAGKILLPQLAVVNAAGEPAGATQAASVQVSSSLTPEDAKQPELSRLRPPVELGLPIWAIAGLALAALAVLAIAFMGWRRWRRGRPPRARPAGPPKPEHEAALEALARLEAARLLEQGQAKRHFFGVSDILKEYLGARYGIDARESTSDELVARLEGAGMSASLLDRVEGLFARLDLVKFTDHAPAAADGARALEDARALVGQTKRLPTVLPAGPGAGVGPTAGPAAGGGPRAV